MKKATFEIDGLFGKSSMEFEGETWSDVADRLNDEQDLFCLANQVQLMGTPADKRKTKAFIDFLSKYQHRTLAREDIASSKLELSIGGFKCVAVADDDDEKPQVAKKTRRCKD